MINIVTVTVVIRSTYTYFYPKHQLINLLLYVHTLNNPSAHPSYSHYYLLNPSTLFFAHLIVLHFYFIAHFTLISLFLPYICSCVVLLYIIFIFILLHCPLSGPDLTYISLLIIPCIIEYVTNKETLYLDLVPCYSNFFNKKIVKSTKQCAASRFLS